MGLSVESSGERETDRLEAFSDGVFAFAITLLVLGLKDPTSGNNVSLFQGLLGEWPTFFAFVTSFTTILIMWMNHHNMFNYISRIDREFHAAQRVAALLRNVNTVHHIPRRHPHTEQ